MHQLPNFVRLSSKATSIIIDCQRKTPVVLYYGEKIHSTQSEQMIALLATRQEPKCGLVQEVPLSLSPCLGNGFTGSPGIDVFNSSNAWSVGARLVSVEQLSEQEVLFISEDSIRKIQISHRLVLDQDTNVLTASTAVTNNSAVPLHINYCAAPTFNLPDHIDKILSFEGRWSMEFQQASIDLFLGAFVRENRKGKTSHDNFPGVIVHEKHANESQGDAYAFHLGWSGNHRTRVELLPEQRTYVQMGELLGNNEIVLAKGASYNSPNLYVSFSANGFGELSHNFHQYVRQHLLRAKITSTPRPVMYNTWEGIYFEHKTSTLMELASIVGELGTERFVLDDGWFKHRRHDRAGLGDWSVDEGIYPDGLQPIIDHVESLGMEFGIWFEPEMVNPDSDLYKAHPDWVLSTEGNPQIAFRHQFVLDLTRREVTDYLFSKINKVLCDYPSIKYIKWDMNRDINHTGDQYGISAIHEQTKNVYKLIEKVKSHHPHVDIESCSSGGARIDYGVLAHTDRVWTSDSNDALERLDIQRGCSFFFPAEIMGSHVGPRDCHITGRRISMETRIAVAMFGSFGMEMDPRELTEADKTQLRAGIELYKSHRELIHSGRLYRSNKNGNSIDFGIVAQDQSSALFSYNSVIESRRSFPKKYRFEGLSPDATYRFNLVWPQALQEYSPSLLRTIESQSFTGESLMQFGMQLPITNPQTSLIFKLTKVQS
ncbi:MULTISPECIES: alpha-galactosidase [Aliiglaciecola]|uniref:alpha-galactosidase n=1 Tax=Aliiglaciecola TaxID=1406885 RepID=UPI001C081D6C|nr:MULTISPECIES: alpha-galactosidase [Aliiglaciecola]MBU2876673.1 alpha-galactosidase [Aliiglaciecola lipolytica]MDO6710264.1 alpha-galactosidase [Aliiglaciecola sp. 2_MG-2023]MDO6751412.1 alpha-galactosidase [Aliiglaciecola sp. 1_MG-2023]